MLVKLWFLSLLAAIMAALLYLNAPHDAYRTLLVFAALGLHVSLTLAWWVRALVRKLARLIGPRSQRLPVPRP